MRRRVLGIVIVLAVALATLTWFVFEKDMTELRARLDGRSQTMEMSFGTIEYAVAGE